MIDVSTSGSKVSVIIETGVDGFNLPLTWETNQQLYAILLRDSIEKHMNERLEKIRRAAYNSGWKDAKAKTKKQNWFAGWW